MNFYYAGNFEVFLIFIDDILLLEMGTLPLVLKVRCNTK
jgi:hypothetical protein